jgi:signal transduction histidine kinase
LSCLLDNAVKFTALGGVRIDVAANDGEVRITISDTGSGISADRIASLFDRFHGTSTEPALAEQGAGLGLPLAKGLTDLIGGALTVDSSVGKGTCVVVSLPLLSPDSAPAPLS